MTLILHKRPGRKLLTMLFILGLVLTTALAAAGFLAPKAAHAASTFTNPISPAADPFMTYYHGNYYLIQSGGDNTIQMRVAASIGSLDSVTPQVIWTDTDPSRNQDIWAPTFFTFNDHWYVYWTGDDGTISNHRMRVLESDGLLSQGANPNGSYHFQSTLNDPANDVMGIDGVPFVANGQMYFVWAAAYCCGFDTLRLSTMSNPYTLSGTSVALNVDSCQGVAEAPSTLYRNGRTWLVYSVCDTGGPDYQLKMESINDGQDPMNPGNWQDEGTVFASNPSANVWSVGSNGFFQSPDGTQDWIVYQAKDTNASGTNTYSARITRAQQFAWNSDGSPNFGSPVGLGVPLAVPSGDPGTGASGTTGPIHAPGGKCVDVAGGNSTSGTAVQLWDCNGSGGQNWTVASNGTLQALGKCLDIIGDGTAAGTKVELWDCNGVGGQQWVPQSNGSLLNPQSGNCLDDPAGNTANGTQLQIWTCNNQWPQVYQLPGQSSSATGPIHAPGGKCVDVSGGNSADGTSVQLWDCNGASAQNWTVASNGTLQALGKCLDIIGDGTAPGTKVELWDCNGVGGQQWVPQSNGSLLNPQSGNCLDDPAGNTADGTQLQIWTCNNQWPQVYQLP